MPLIYIIRMEVNSNMSFGLTKNEIIAKEICEKITIVRNEPHGNEIAEDSGNSIVNDLYKRMKPKLAKTVGSELADCHKDINWNFNP